VRRIEILRERDGGIVPNTCRTHKTLRVTSGRYRLAALVVSDRVFAKCLKTRLGGDSRA